MVRTSRTRSAAPARSTSCYVVPGTISIDSWDDEPHAARYYRRLAAFLRARSGSTSRCRLVRPARLRGPRRPSQGWQSDALAVLDAVGCERGRARRRRWRRVGGDRARGRAPDRCADLVVDQRLCVPRAPTTILRTAIPRPTRRILPRDKHRSGRQWDLEGADDLALIAPSVHRDLRLREWWTHASRRGASPATARALVSVSSLADVRERLAGGARSHAGHALPRQSFHPRRARAVPRVAHRGCAVRRAAGCRPRAVGRQRRRGASTRSRSSSPARRHAADVTACSPRCCSPTSSTRPATPPRSATGRGARLLDAHDAIVRDELGALRRAGGQHHRRRLRRAFDSPTQAVRAAPAIVDAAARQRRRSPRRHPHRRVRAARRRPRRARRAHRARGSPRWRHRARCSSRARSSDLVARLRRLRFVDGASTSSRACPSAGSSSRSSPESGPDRPRRLA